MTVRTISQSMAQTAYERMAARRPNQEFRSFARSFPSLIHACGLAQAVAFAKAKGRKEYVEDLTQVLQSGGYSGINDLDQTARTAPMTTYVRLSRHALQAAGWIKRYVEAMEE